MRKGNRLWWNVNYLRRATYWVHRPIPNLKLICKNMLIKVRKTFQCRRGALLIWRYIHKAMNTEWWIRPTFGCKNAKVTRFWWNSNAMCRATYRIYKTFQIDISKHVEGKSIKLVWTNGRTSRQITTVFQTGVIKTRWVDGTPTTEVTPVTTW